jgi:carboxyl-terminal processing protease
MRVLTVLMLWGWAGAAFGLGQGVDLGKHYAAKLGPSPARAGCVWTCDPGDVWSLSSFTYVSGDRLKIELGPATVVFGKHDACVLWAAVLPDEPGKLTAAATGGGDDAVMHLWLRFHPSRVAELFPPATVKGPGNPEKRRVAKRICAWKLHGSWQSAGLPVVPDKNALVIDLDTAKHVRRFFSGDTAAGGLDYYSDFEPRALPESEKIDRKTALEIFDGAWKAFDREYAMFTIKPQVDWSSLREQYRPQAERAGTAYEAAAIVSEMLEHLEDLHVWVRVGSEMIPGYSRPRPLNANWQALVTKITGFTDLPQGLAWGRTEDGIGYVNIYRLGNGGLPRAFDDVLDKLGATWGLVFDLRFNGGGDELLARKVAGRFLDEKCVYSLNQYRSGPEHTDLGEKHERVCQPHGPWRYESPVVVLLGQQTMSSAESFALMLAQVPQVTTMGTRTAGSSANPRELPLPMQVTVSLPRWLDMRPDGTPIDGVGVQPEIPVAAAPEAFTETSDPVLEAALQHLRKISPAERQPGKRD